MSKKSVFFVEDLLSSLTLEEKIALVSGHDFMYTNAVPRLGIPSIRMSDGPHGLRVQEDNSDNGVTGSLPATSFPTAACSANSFNPALLEKLGNAIGLEARHYGIDIVLGPSVNIKRNPLCGRNFEYFSEDPLLSGILGASEVIGIQTKEVGVAVKHFALNNSETFRFMGNSLVDMRAMREIYLKQFEYIVKKAKPEALMSAYNQINGTYCSENKWLLNDLPRKEWGFDGLIMTDWGGTHNRVAGIKAGQDLEMPGDTLICRKWLEDAIKDGTLDIALLDEAVRNVLKLVLKHHSKKEEVKISWEEHDKLAKQVALEGAVLLKNDDILPLKKDESIIVIGELFEKMRYQGAGSSMINPTKLTSPKIAFDEQGVKYDYVIGYKENSLEVNTKLVEEAVKKAKDYTKVVLFLGLTDYVESEGGDRQSMSLPQNQVALVSALTKEHQNVVVVLFGGSVIELPFYQNVKGILNMFLPGQNGGMATYELLYGLANPSGRLAETWPISYHDVPFGKEYSNTPLEIYKESIFVGYRYYLTADKGVRFPFGFGLSYTKFKYEDLVTKMHDNKLEVTLKVTNIGEVKGDEVVQVYLSKPNSQVYRSLRELKGFSKVTLDTNEFKVVTISIPLGDLAVWSLKDNCFVIEQGIYEIQVAKNCNDIILKESVTVEGEDVSDNYSEAVLKVYQAIDIDKVTNELFEKMSGLVIPPLQHKLPITLESKFTDLRSTFMGKLLYNSVLSVAHKEIKKARRMKPGVEKDNKLKGALFMKTILENNSLRSLSMSARESFPYNFACGFKDLANGHLFKGIKQFTTKIKAPKLPSKEKK